VFIYSFARNVNILVDIMLQTSYKTLAGCATCLHGIFHSNLANSVKSDCLQIMQKTIIKSCLIHSNAAEM